MFSSPSPLVHIMQIIVIYNNCMFKFLFSKLRCLIKKWRCQYQSLTFSSVYNSSGIWCPGQIGLSWQYYLHLKLTKVPVVKVSICSSNVLSLLFEKESRSSLDPLVGVGTTGKTDVRDHLHPLWAHIQRQPDTLLRCSGVSSRVLGSKAGHTNQ